MRTFLKTAVIAAILLAAAPALWGASLQAGQITDEAGRIIRTDKPFGRIISLYSAHTENLKDLGADSQVIGTHPGETWPDKPKFSQRDGLEKFLAARPDMVLVRPMLDRGYPQLMEGLEKAGVAVVSLQPSTVEEMLTYWRILGALAGRKSQAEAMARKFQEEMTSCQALTRNLPRKKRVYFEAIHSQMKTCSPGSMALFVLDAAGGVNVAADAKPVRDTNIAAYGKERILSHAGEIDVFLAQRGAMNQATVDMIINEPGFSIIKAVRENQVFIVDEAIVSRPTMSLVRGVHAIGALLYPDIFEKEAGP